MTAGIVPFNQNKMLERFPGCSGREQQLLNKDAVDETSKNMLKEMRYDTENTKTTQRKKRDVKAGESIRCPLTKQDQGDSEKKT